MAVATRAACGRCGAPTDLQLHDHWSCFPCMRAWSRWLDEHPREGPVLVTRVNHAALWLAAYERFLAESNGTALGT